MTLVKTNITPIVPEHERPRTGGGSPVKSSTMADRGTRITDDVRERISERMRDIARKKEELANKQNADQRKSGFPGEQAGNNSKIMAGVFLVIAVLIIGWLR